VVVICPLRDTCIRAANASTAAGTLRLWIKLEPVLAPVFQMDLTVIIVGDNERHIAV
jgi:hypothetical protein